LISSGLSDLLLAELVAQHKGIDVVVVAKDELPTQEELEQLVLKRLPPPEQLLQTYLIDAEKEFHEVARLDALSQDFDLDYKKPNQPFYRSLPKYKKRRDEHRPNRNSKKH
jgi:hypothetical protein